MDDNYIRDLDQEVELGGQDPQAQGIEEAGQEATEKVKDSVVDYTKRKFNDKRTKTLKDQLNVDKKLDGIKNKSTQATKEGAKKAGEFAGREGAKAGMQAAGTSGGATATGGTLAATEGAAAAAGGTALAAEGTAAAAGGAAAAAGGTAAAAGGTAAAAGGTAAAAAGTAAAGGAATGAAGGAAAAAGSAIAAAAPVVGFVAIGVALVALIVYASGVILDNEASRTNEGNYQHQSVKDVNHTSKNGIELTDSNNVFFNKDTKRYELGKGRTPTQANKLYYVYYAVMSQQSRWFVEFERTDAKPGDPDAGTEKNPYWKPIKREGDASKYTLDGYLFNNNVLDKVNLRPVNPDKPLTLENIVDETAVKSIDKLSLNTNLLYLLNSTLNGNIYGTGKNEMFFAEQFVKPVYHDDKDYSFKSLTEVRDMSDKEKEEYKAKAHGAEEDGKRELEFQKKYERWGQTLDVQNEARGGGSTAGDKDNGDAGSADGIDNPLLKKAFEWGLSQLDKGITYSMANRGGPNSYDCSSFVTRALTEAGMTGVDGLSTVGMLQNSNALGQSGTKFKEVDYKTAKKGTIIVVGGLAGGGANGHTFFLAEDFHGDDTKVLECNGGTNGIANWQTFKTQSMNYNQVVALEPIEDGNTKSTSGSSSSKKGKSSKKHNTSGDYSKEQKNKYQDKISTGKLEAQSRVFDTAYSPKVVKNLYREDDINEKVWKRGDFYISSETGSLVGVNSEIDVNQYIAATYNSKFTIGSGAITDSKGKAKVGSSDKAVLPSDYWDYRDELTSWCLKNGYNPAFIVSLIKVLTDDGNAELAGSKFNFLNDKDAVKLSDAEDSDDKDKDDKDKDKKDEEKDKDKDKNKEENKQQNSVEDQKDKDKDKDKKKDKDKDKDKDKNKKKDSSSTSGTNSDGKTDSSGGDSEGGYGSEDDDDKKDETDDKTWLDYGKKYYNYQSNVADITTGLEYLSTKFSEDNENLDWNYDVAKKLKISKRDFNKINRFYTKAGGRGSAHAKIADDEVKKVTVYTYGGSGNEDTKALGVISVDGKPDDTEIDGQKKYYTVKKNIKQADAVKPGTAGSDHPYAIKRGKDGKPEMKKGIWDYGFGAIFKIAKQKYEAYEIGIDEHGNYYIAKNESEGLISFLINNDVTSDTQYQVLGATTAFGSIDMSNEIVESQWEIEKVIEKLKNGEELSGADVAVLEKHKEGTSLKVNGKEVVAAENNFFVSTKPKIEKDPEVQNINGAQYLYDYVENYETYIPSSTQKKLNVVDRWKAMNDANASTQEATDKIMDIFNRLVGDGKSKSSSDSGSGGDTSGGTGEAGLDMSPEAVKARKQAYDLLIEGGMGSKGAIGIITNWVAESGVDPTSTFGEYVSKYQVSETDKNTALNTTKPIGLGQWMDGRHTNLLSYAQQKGKQWSDLDLQLDFMLHGESESIRQTLVLVAQAKDYTQAASRFFMGWEIHGGGASYADNDPHSDPLAQANNIEGHLDKKVSAALWKELVEPDGEKEPDISKLTNGSSTLSDSGGSSTSGSSGTISNWGDGTGFAAIISNFLSKIQGTVLTLFGGNENWDPTMFATDPTFNTKTLYTGKDGGQKEDTYEPDTLYVNGADAYTWTKYGNKLSDKNATMLVRQFVASLESRDERPVYYDEVFENFDEYEISRILEENYKLVFKDLFKPKKDAADERKADITTGPFKGVGLAETEVVAGYGWRKVGNDVKLNPGYVFKGEAGAEVVSMKPGKVVYSGSDLSTGTKTVIIRSKNNTEQIAYSNLGSLSGLKVGDDVQAGDVIGKAPSDGEITVYGINAKQDCANGLPRLPTEVDNNSAYFDLGHNFGLSVEGRKKLLKEVNGYDPDKNTVKKPKAKKMKGKPAKLSTFFDKGDSEGGVGDIGDGSYKDIQPNYAGNNYPVGECTWGAKALAPWAGNTWGNGGMWANSARAEGFTVDSTPRVGSIACWTDGGYGHVAVVVAVESPSRIQVKESNYAGNRTIGNYRGWFDPRYCQGTVSYIHPKS